MIELASVNIFNKSAMEHLLWHLGGFLKLAHIRPNINAIARLLRHIRHLAFSRGFEERLSERVG